MAGLLQQTNPPPEQDPFYGLNLQSVNSSAFLAPWWYRCGFTAAGAARTVAKFEGELPPPSQLRAPTPHNPGRCCELTCITC